MSLEENKAIVYKVIEAENKKDPTVLDDLIAPDFYDQTLKLKGPQGYKQFLTILFKAFPDWYETIEDVIAEDDKVCVILTINTGIHKYEFRGVPPTGKSSIHKSIQIWQIANSKVVKKYSIYDHINFFKQLGLIEFTEKGKKLFPEE